MRPRAAERARGAALGRATHLMVMLALALVVVACHEPYRIGDCVWVEWEKGAYYPAYIVERPSESRYRVHFEGYPARWDETVTLDRIRGRVEGQVTPPPPPKRVRAARGLDQKKATPAGAEGSGARPVSRYKVGDRVRVRWRGSVYGATVSDIVSTDRVLVHYDGHEAAWDEIIPVDRIVTKR